MAAHLRACDAPRDSQRWRLRSFLAWSRLPGAGCDTVQTRHRWPPRRRMGRLPRPNADPSARGCRSCGVLPCSGSVSAVVAPKRIGSDITGDWAVAWWRQAGGTEFALGVCMPVVALRGASLRPQAELRGRKPPKRSVSLLAVRRPRATLAPSDSWSSFVVYKQSAARSTEDCGLVRYPRVSLRGRQLPGRPGNPCTRRLALPSRLGSHEQPMALRESSLQCNHEQLAVINRLQQCRYIHPGAVHALPLGAHRG
jgi:hypothetical protein